LEAPQLKQQQGEVEPRGAEGPLEPQRGAERLDGRIRGGAVRLDDAKVVPRERVLGVHLHRLPVGGERVLRAAGLMQHHAPLVPQLGGIRDLAQPACRTARGLMKTEDMRTNKAREESYVYLQHARLPAVIPLILKTHPSTILTPARITNEMPTSFIAAGPVPIALSA